MIASIYSKIGDYNNAIKYSEISIENNMAKNEGMSYSFVTAFIHKSLSYKRLGKQFDENEMQNIIKDYEELNYKNDYNWRYYDHCYHLYLLLENTSYLETAYNQIQEKVSAMDEKLKAKFLSYPIPAEIVEEWEKVN